MDRLNLTLRPGSRSSLPIKALQFGEGNFIRAYIDWMLCRCNQQGLFNGRVLALQCTPHGKTVPKLKEQDGLFTVICRSSKEDGSEIYTRDIVNTIADMMNPYEEWEKVLAAAVSSDIRFIFSNTTEAGLEFVHEEPFNTDVCPKSFPGKLTAVLYERYKRFEGKKGHGLYIIPCELVEDNGDVLKDLVMRQIRDQGLSDDFLEYVLYECSFVNTLVDRVVSGYPEDAERFFRELGYEDSLLTCCENFHFLAMQGGQNLAAALPFAVAGLNAVVADDITPYRARKIRLLNGTHTACVPAAVLAGLSTVDEMMCDPLTGRFTRELLLGEIVPSVRIESCSLEGYAQDVIKRFAERSVRHRLESILTSSTLKMRNRVIPTVTDARSRGKLPLKLCLAIASYIRLYKDTDGTLPVRVMDGDRCLATFNDDAYAVEVMHNAFKGYRGTEDSAIFTVNRVLSDVRLWGCDLSSDADLCLKVARLLHAVCSDGIRNTMADVLEHAG